MPDDPRFFNPVNMPEQVRGFLHDSGQAVPDDPIGLVRVILESLALRYASVIRRIQHVTGRPIRGLRIMGGGSQNRFLNQATADAANLEVQAGPVEATALGNLTVQAIADGFFADVADARRFIARHLPAERVVPSAQDAWGAAREQYAALEATLESLGEGGQPCPGAEQQPCPSASSGHPEPTEG